MHSFEDERCYTVARLASKLESGCRQLLHKLKSCEATHKKNVQVMKCTLHKTSRWPESFIIFCGFVTKKGAELSKDPLTICDASWGASEDRLSL